MENFVGIGIQKTRYQIQDWWPALVSSRLYSYAKWTIPSPAWRYCETIHETASLLTLWVLPEKLRFPVSGLWCGARIGHFALAGPDFGPSIQHSLSAGQPDASPDRRGFQWCLMLEYCRRVLWWVEVTLPNAATESAGSDFFPLALNSHYQSLTFAALWKKIDKLEQRFLR